MPAWLHERHSSFDEECCVTSAEYGATGCEHDTACVNMAVVPVSGDHERTSVSELFISYDTADTTWYSRHL